MEVFRKIIGKLKSIKQKSDINQNNLSELKKGDKSVSTGNNIGYKIVNDLTDKQKEEIDKSTILLRTGQLFMHYWTDNLICKDRNDQEWQNKVMFFWKANEDFPKKSLPPIFDSYKEKYFLFKGNTSQLSIQAGKAAPWFGMPGLGEKFYCERNDIRQTIPELNRDGFVEYFEKITLPTQEFELLTDKDNYFILNK
jgi:hypothetical protein